MVTTLFAISSAAIAAAIPNFRTLELSPAHTTAPLRVVSPEYISFALDNAFVRTNCRPRNPTAGGGNATCLPDDQTNSTRIDFQDPLLKKVLSLTAGGYIRIGGTYTDFVHYEVDGTNYTRCPHKNMTAAGHECPGNSFPCCLPLPMARWKEALEFAHSVGMKITFNLNVLHGRWDDFTAAHKCRRHDGPCPPTGPHGYRPSWDSSNARALMQYTASLPREIWPARFGLGNELQWYLPPQQWAEDVVRMNALIKEVFPSGSAVPKTYAPCNSGLLGEWTGEFLANVTALDETALGAFSFHGYQHRGVTPENIGEFPGVDASRQFFEQVYQQDWKNGSALEGGELWITETAWAAQAVQGAARGGPQAPLEGMCTAADMAWNLDALGAAAEVGVDVFCRETLAGDWLEVLGLWQPREQRAYTPHPDFLIAALWRMLMSEQVLGVAEANASSTAAFLPHPRRNRDRDGWVTFPGYSSAYEKCGPNGSALFPYLGTVDTVADCEARCAARKGCQSFSWDSSTPPGVWAHRCFGQMDGQFHLDKVANVISGCHSSNPQCKMPPPPPTTVRPYAHCSRRTPGGVTFAISAAPCVRNVTEQIELQFPGAESLTSYWLSASSVANNVVMLNGKNVTFAADTPLPSLDGEVSSGDRVVMPGDGVCVVGFVDVKYQKPVPACQA